MYKEVLTWRWLWVTVCERISCVIFWTCTNRCMIDHNTIGIKATRTRTRITALFIDASLITWTFWIYRAFWTAVWRRSSVGRQAWTRWWSVKVTTFREWTTWWWLTRISVRFIFRRQDWCWSRMKRFCIWFLIFILFSSGILRGWG